MRSLLSLLLLLGLAPILHAQTATLRDITVVRNGTKGTITFTFNQGVKTVVVERTKTGVAQVRMKSVAASIQALGSARTRSGIRSVTAHIERTDVLVVNTAFTSKVKTMTVRERKGSRVVVEVSLDGTASPTVSTPTGARSTTRRTSDTTARTRTRSTATSASSTSRTSSSNSRKKYTVVIDAGHGGYDPGAIGVDSLREKVITLAVVRKLKAELQKLRPGIKIIMTRSDDRYVALDRRAALANSLGADLFVSVHCNWSQHGATASGFEIYVPRPPVAPDTSGTQRDAASLKRLFDYKRRMARCARSRKLAQAIAGRFRNDLTLGDRGVYEAGFVVLLGTTMPAVLVELGYISHPGDSRLLRTAGEQTHFARALAKGIVQALEG